jgi:hypothetical protein
MIDSDGAKSTTILVDHTVYFRGDLKTIVAYKFSPKHPTAIVGRWISIGATSKYYAGASASLTLASDFLKVNLLGPLTEGSDVAIDGIQAVPIYGQVKSSNGTQTAKATIYVTASGTTLPVEFHATTGAVDETINWSQWGRRVTIDAPHSAIPIAKLPS